MSKYPTSLMIIVTGLFGAASGSLAYAQPGASPARPAEAAAPALRCADWRRLPDGSWMALASAKIADHSIASGSTVAYGDVQIGKKSLTDLLDAQCPGR